MPLDSNYRWFEIKFNKPSKTYHCRGLTRKELRFLGTKESKFAADTSILEQCVLEQENWSLCPYGVAQKLLEQIYSLSGFGDTNKPADEALNWSTSENGMLELVAITQIPSCSLTTLDNCDPFDYHRYLFAGKFMFEMTWKVGIETLLYPPEQEKGQVQYLEEVTEHGHLSETFVWKAGG